MDHQLSRFTLFFAGILIASMLYCPWAHCMHNLPPKDPQGSQSQPSSAHEERLTPKVKAMIKEMAQNSAAFSEKMHQEYCEKNRLLFGHQLSTIPTTQELSAQQPKPADPDNLDDLYE